MYFRALIKAHLNAVRQMHPMLGRSDVTVVPIIELACMGPQILIPAFKEYCQERRLRCVPYRGTRDGRLGLVATHATQTKAIEIMRILLRTPDSIKIAEGLVSVGKAAIYPHLQSESPRAVLNRLAKQVEAVRYDPTTNKYTGKMGDFFQDDLAMALLNGIYVDCELEGGMGRG